MLGRQRDYSHAPRLPAPGKAISQITQGCTTITRFSLSHRLAPTALCPFGRRILLPIIAMTRRAKSGSRPAQKAPQQVALDLLDRHWSGFSDRSEPSTAGALETVVAWARQKS